MEKRLVAQMIVRNEEKRYLRQVLSSLSEYVDKIIILDDNSTDNTVAICKEFPKADVHLSDSKECLFNKNESELRNKLWKLVRADKPDWVISIDADEEFDKTFKDNIEDILNCEYDWISVKLCDMWEKDSYRIDGYWSPLITRVYKFKDEPFGKTGELHCGCVPNYIDQSNKGYCLTEAKLLHWGWLTQEDKDRKYDFYVKKAEGINLQHALTIKQPARLLKLADKTELPRVMFCSLIKNRDWCLDKMLDGFNSLDYPKELIDIYFIINDSTDKSLDILKTWKHQKEYSSYSIDIMNFNVPSKDHSWPDKTLDCMRIMRDKCLNKFRDNDRYGDNDYIFMVDSDIQMTAPGLLKHLVLLERDVVSEVFWATWGGHIKAEGKSFPNVWINGGYHVTEPFLQMLKRKGNYKVGGLGACTVLRKGMLKLPSINYQKVHNLPSDMRGEDRDFSIRCGSQTPEIFLWADTYHTPIHMEKEDYIKEQKKQCPKLIKDLSICIMVKNEESCIRNMLENIKGYSNDIVIVDTGSTDNTKKICKEYTNKIYDFEWCNDFSACRNFAMKKATRKFILRIDADEIIPEETWSFIEEITQRNDVDAVLFPIKNYQEDVSKNINANWVLSETIRLFKRSPEVIYKGIVHEDIDDSLTEMGKKRPIIILKSSYFMLHYGYLKEGKQKNDKFEYYAKLCRKQIELEPNNYRPYFNFAVHLMSMGHINEAEGYYLKALELKPNLWVLNYDLGIIAFKKSFNRDLLDISQRYMQKALGCSEQIHSNHKKKILGAYSEINRLRKLVGDGDDSK